MENEKEITFTLNNEKVIIEVDPQWTLLYLLREVLEMTGTKEGCGYGECGACTVIIDGEAVNSCLYPIMEVEGKTVMTIEGVASKDGGLDLNPAGLCRQRGRPVRVLHTGHDHVIQGPSHQKGKTDRKMRSRRVLRGNLYRCTGYVKIIDAIKTVAGGR